MDTTPSPPIDPVDYFIEQCEALRVAMSSRGTNRGRPVNFGPHAAIEVLHAIGKYLYEHPEVEDPE